MRRYWRALQRVWQLDIYRLQPIGHFNWCYLRPKLPPRQALFRQLWWRTRYKLPRVLWLPLELWRWIYWQLWAAPKHIRRALLENGLATQTSDGISLLEQQHRLEFWAKSWTIKPDEAYLIGLFKKPYDACDVILGNEIQPFHQLMNENRTKDRSGNRLLSDKSALAARLAPLNIPVVHTLHCSKGDFSDLLDALNSTPKLFCKLRAGSRGESAFFAEKTGQKIQGRTLLGHVLHDEKAIQLAWHELAQKGDILIQPYLQNHPLLDSLSSSIEPITIRIITCAPDITEQHWPGLLYIQVEGDWQDREYWLLTLDTATGQLSNAFGHWQEQVDEQGNFLPLNFLNGQPVPFWQELLRYSKLAHAEIPDVWTIAWDWIVTSAGPKLLEGNSGWGLEPLQELGIDFVKIGTEETGDSLGQ